LLKLKANEATSSGAVDTSSSGRVIFWKARPTSFANASLPSTLLRSRATDSLLRLQDRK